MPNYVPIGLVCALLVSPGAAFGQQNVREYDRFYAGAAVVLSDVEDRYLRITYSDTPWTLQASAGYRYDWNWSVEAAWQTLDDIEDRDVRGSGLDRLDITSSIETASLRIRFWIPISEIYELDTPFTVYGFAGPHASDIERSATDLTTGTRFDESETEYGITFGGGAIVGIGRINVRGSLERIDLDASGGSIVAATVGVEFYF